MANPNFKQINVDIETYEAIKSNGAKANRSIAGEIRQMLAIVSAPKDGKEFIVGLANIVKADGDVLVEDATGKTVIAAGGCIQHEPAREPIETFPPSQEYLDALQSVEEKEA